MKLFWRMKAHFAVLSVIYGSQLILLCFKACTFSVSPDVSISAILLARKINNELMWVARTVKRPLELLLYTSLILPRVSPSKAGGV